MRESVLVQNQNRDGEASYFTVRLLLAQEIQKVALIFAVRGKCSSFLCFIKGGSYDQYQDLLQLLALAILNSFSSKERDNISVSKGFFTTLPRLQEHRYTTHLPCPG